MGNNFFPLKIGNESKWVQLTSPSKGVLPEGPIRFMMLFITHFAVRAMGDQMSSSNRDKYKQKQCELCFDTNTACFYKKHRVWNN